MSSTGTDGPWGGLRRWRMRLGTLTFLLAAFWAGCFLGKVQSGGKQQHEDGGQGRLAGTVRMAGSTSMEEMVWALAEAFMEKYPDVTVTVEFVGSSAGAEAVIRGSADIGNLSRSLSPEEEAQGLLGNKVAEGGIAVCVDASNPVTELTERQLEDIYSGKITNWREAGGENVPIVVVGREAGSGTREAFEEALGLKDRCAYANEMDSTGAVMARVANTPGAIGYISLDAANGTVRLLKLINILVCPYIMATKGEISAQSAPVQAWFAFIRSREGQDILKRILGT